MKLKATKYILLKWMCFLVLATFFGATVYAQKGGSKKETVQNKKTGRILYGQASYYANKFHGRKTASGEIFNHDNLTAACNVLPLGTRVKVTNLKNGKSIIVKTNDRLHTKTRRIIDLTKAGAKKLDFVKRGLTRVKIEVLDK